MKFKKYIFLLRRIFKFSTKTYYGCQHRYCKHHSGNGDIGGMDFDIASFRFYKPTYRNRNYNRDDGIKKSFKTIIIISILVIGCCESQEIAVSPIKTKR